MEPVEGALKLVGLTRTGYFDQYDVEVGIGIARLSDSRTEATRLAGKYMVKKLSGKTMTSDPDVFPKAVGWLWMILNSEGQEGYDALVMRIRLEVERFSTKPKLATAFRDYLMHYLMAKWTAAVEALGDKYSELSAETWIMTIQTVLSTPEKPFDDAEMMKAFSTYTFKPFLGGQQVLMNIYNLLMLRSNPFLSR